MKVTRLAVLAVAFAALTFDAPLFGLAANNGQMAGEIYAAAKPAEIFVDTATLVLGRSEVKKPERSPLARLSRAEG